MSDLGIAVRRLLGERRLSLHELSRRSHWDVGYLSKVINGHKSGSYALVRDLDRVLNAGGELLDLWTGTRGFPVVQAISAATDSDLAGSATETPRTFPARRKSCPGGMMLTSPQALPSWQPTKSGRTKSSTSKKPRACFGHGATSTAAALAARR